jgi:uncharacterized iron-regulated membrane protein
MHFTLLRAGKGIPVRLGPNNFSWAVGYLMTEITSGTRSRSFFANVSIKKTLAFIHLWVGIIFAIPFVLLGLSGSYLMLDHPSKRFDAAAALQRSIADIVQAAQAVAPEGARLSGYDAPAAQGANATVRFAPGRTADEAPRRGPPGSGNIRVTVNPADLHAEPVAAGPRPAAGQGRSFARLMHDLHGRLLIDGVGRPIVGWLGVFMTFLGLSGLVMWWPRKSQIKQALTFRFGKSALKTNRDMHGAVGIWGWLVFVIVSFSGVYICFPQAINAMVGASAAVRDARGTAPIAVAPIEGIAPMALDDAAAMALDLVPTGAVRSIQVPVNPHQPYRVQISRDGDYNGVPRATVIIDQWRQSVIELRDPQGNYSTLDKFLTWQRQLHAGNGLGWWWWGLVFLSGFLPLLFVVTGVTMWWMKRKNRLRMQAP